MKEDIFEIKTKRLIIRHLNEADFDLWKEAYLSMLPPMNPWDLAHKKRPPLTRTYFKKMLREQKKNRAREEFFDYAVIDRKSKKYIGRVSLMNIIRSITQSAFIGYILFNNYWDKGYAQEAVNGLIELAFNQHGLHRVVAGIEPKNKRSIALAKKLGMRREGISKRVVHLREEWQDLVQFALTTEDRHRTWKGKTKIRQT